ncbi:hypothetical protein HZ996_08335 [Cryomorphaceae bacterium]|nr:hypothetical protein HZ996_08335 [Cryomorphaceae bacterium]
MKIVKKEWESNFFDRAMWSLDLERRKWSYEDIPDFASRLDELFEETGQGLYDCELDARYLFLAPALEDRGFRLWDSRFQFITRFKREELPHYPYDLPEEIELRSYSPSDKAQIHELNKKYLIQAKQLVTKFRSSFFPADASERWFTAWIDNSLEEGGYCSVLDRDGVLEGFFIYLRREYGDGLPLFKGVLTSITPEYRGKNLHLAMQEQILRDQISDPEYYLDNSTQIGNIPVVKNHFNSHRKPTAMNLIFLMERK